MVYLVVHRNLIASEVEVSVLSIVILSVAPAILPQAFPVVLAVAFTCLPFRNTIRMNGLMKCCISIYFVGPSGS